MSYEIRDRLRTALDEAVTLVPSTSFEYSQIRDHGTNTQLVDLYRRISIACPLLAPQYISLQGLVDDDT